MSVSLSVVTSLAGSGLLVPVVELRVVGVGVVVLERPGVDADDVWLPGKLAQQVALLAAWPEAAMVYGLSQWWYSWTGRPEDRDRDFLHPLGLLPNSVVQPPELIDRFFLRQDATIPSPSNILVRRASAERVGGFEDRFKFFLSVFHFTPAVALNMS